MIENSDIVPKSHDRKAGRAAAALAVLKERAPSASASGLMQDMGLTDEEISRRKRFVGLDEDDAERVLSLKPLVERHADSITEAFFEHVAAFDDTRRLFRDPQMLARAKDLKRRHLIAMVDGPYDPDYVLGVAELAQVYNEGQMDVRMVTGGCHSMMHMLGELILDANRGDERAGFQAFQSLERVAFFDLALIAEVLFFHREAIARSLGAQASPYARSLIEASLDPLLTINPDGMITDANEATVKVTGIVRERLIGTDFSNYFTEPEKARDAHKTVFEKGSITDYPLTLCGAAGNPVDVLYNASVYKDARGKVLALFAAARVVTAQKQANLYARSLLEASLDPLVTISPDGKITDVNQATVKVTGVPRGKLIGTDFSNYFTEPEKAREGYKAVFEKGFVTDYPLTILNASGALVEVMYNASVYKDSRNNVLGVFAAARNVTAQRRAEAELAAQRSREQERLAELERFHKLVIGRELKMVELKKQLEELKQRIGGSG